MSGHLDWFDSLDIDELLDVGSQTARDMAEHGPGYGIEPTRYSRSGHDAATERQVNDLADLLSERMGYTVQSCRDALWAAIPLYQDRDAIAAEAESLTREGGWEPAPVPDLAPADTPGDPTP